MIPWLKTGVPLRWIGPVPSPNSSERLSSLVDAPPSYLEPWLELTNFRLPENDHLLAGTTVSDTGDVVMRRYVLGLGQRNPVFLSGLPSNFVQRLGRLPAEFHFSGTYEADGLRIGYLRLPNFAPPNLANAILELQTEVAFLEQNTDGLVVDVMRNTGGGCYMINAASYLIPYPFYFFGEEIRVTISRINGIQAALETAQRAGAPPPIIEIYTEMLRQLEAAYRENRGRTGPIPACSLQTHDNPPARNAQGNVIAYTKPLIVLVDEFSISAGDIFPAMLQDNRRGPLVGTRTNGAGGSIQRLAPRDLLGIGGNQYQFSGRSHCSGQGARLPRVTLHREPRGPRRHSTGVHDAREPAQRRASIRGGLHARDRGTHSPGLRGEHASFAVVAVGGSCNTLAVAAAGHLTEDYIQQGASV